MPEIHPTAIVEEGATLADDVVVGAYCRVGGSVRIGAGSRLHHGSVVEGQTELGERNEVFPYAILGTVPQDKKYRGEPTGLQVGHDNIIREHVTINIGTAGGGGLTRIGDHNLLMAGAHVGHDCVIGDHCVLSFSCGLAGHVIVEDYAVLGGMTGVHQFCRLGTHCMAAAGAKVGKDVPPYTIAQGYPARLRGINQVGLRRRGFSDETIRNLRQVYRLVFFEPARFEEVLERTRQDYATSVEAQRFLDFLVDAKSSDRGFLRPLRSEENGSGEGD